MFIHRPITPLHIIIIIIIISVVAIMMRLAHSLCRRSVHRHTQSIVCGCVHAHSHVCRWDIRCICPYRRRTLYTHTTWLSAVLSIWASNLRSFVGAQGVHISCCQQRNVTYANRVMNEAYGWRKFIARMLLCAIMGPMRLVE